MKQLETMMVHCCECDNDDHEASHSSPYTCPNCTKSFEMLYDECDFCHFIHTKQQNNGECDRDECGGTRGAIERQMLRGD